MPVFIATRIVAAAYAPTEMNAPCAKFMTSISPNTSVSPDAMMKIIMPMARPATVRVTQVGTLAMARTQQPDSAGSQFYITVVPTPQLDGGRPPYVVFGQVIEGVDVVVAIGKVPTGPGDRPLTPVVIKTVKIDRVK